MTNTPTECANFRDALLDDQHGRLATEAATRLHAHLQTCASCAALDRQERWLSDLLRTRLPRPRAPQALRERLLAELTPGSADAPPMAAAAIMPRPRAWWQSRGLGAALAAAALVAAVGIVVVRPSTTAITAPASPSSESVFREAVNDHLRVVYAEHPIEIESGGIHQVKPWFTGRLDFAPDITFSGDDDFPMIGGAVGYFVDRKAATLVFKRRLHTISCFVFRAQSLPWPRGEERAIRGGPHAQYSALDGFHVLLWREGDLAHALVSDVSEGELMQLASKLVQR
jgi:anti-sigma factor RsiW